MFIWYVFVFDCFAAEIDLINTEARIFGNGIITQDLVRSKEYKSYTSIVIEEGPTEIAAEAFRECTNLVNISIPLSITEITSCFFRCYSLTNFFIKENHQFFCCPKNKAIYSLNKTVLYMVAPNYQEFTFDENVQIIFQNAFSCYRGRQPLTIPKTVQEIQAGAFCETYLIDVIYFEEGSIIKQINGRSMWYTSAAEIHIPPSVVTIGAEAMYSSKSTKIIFDNIEESNCTTINTFAFSFFLGETITLPPKLTSITAKLFEGSSNLISVNIPKDCSKISETAFSKCPKLAKITVDSGNAYFMDANGTVYDITESFLVFLPPSAPSLYITSKVQKLSSGIIQSNTVLFDITVDENNEYLSAKDGVLYDKHKTAVIGICGGRKSATFVSTVNSIEETACALSGLEGFSFEIDDNCTIFKTSAFQSCLSLTTAFIPKSIKTIQNKCFLDCTKLSVVAIDIESSELTSISEDSFRSTAISNFTFTSKVHSIGTSAFASCLQLNTVDFSRCESLETIGNSAFYQSVNIASITLPSTVKTIQNSAFYRLGSTIFDLSNCKNIRTIGTYAFYQSGISSIEFGTALESIAEYTFFQCSNLVNVKFDSGCPLDTIAPAVFQDCINLPKITLPKGIKSAEPSAFKGCTSLQSINAHTESEFLETNEGILYTLGCKTLLINPPGRTLAATASDVEKIGSNAFYMCTKLQEIKMDISKKLVEIAESTFTGCTSLTVLAIPSGIRTIGARSFSDCEKLSIVTFDDNSLLECIETSLFENCAQLSSITFGANSAVSEIKKGAFAGCSHLSSIIIPSNCSKIDSGAFDGCGVTNITFKSDSKLNSLEQGSFQNANKLKEFSFPPNCVSFESGVFEGCTSLSKISFSDWITDIPECAFESLSSLSYANLNNIHSIGALSFSKTSLKEIWLGKQLTSIGQSAFSETPLHTVLYCGSPLTLTSSNVFPKDVIVFVSKDYSMEVFFGKPVLRAIDPQTCQFVGTPLVTHQFTLPSGFDTVNGILIASILQSSEGE